VSGAGQQVQAWRPAMAPRGELATALRGKLVTVRLAAGGAATCDGTDGRRAEGGTSAAVTSRRSVEGN